MTTTTNANATTSKPRRNYRFVNTSDKFATLNLVGARAFHAATLDTFVSYFTDTDYKIVAASANVKHSEKRGDTYEIVLTTSNFGIVHITTNTTAALDWCKVATRFVTMCEKRRAKAAEAAKPENVAEKAAKKVERAAKRYYNYLLRHGMSEDAAKAAADAYQELEAAKLAA